MAPPPRRTPRSIPDSSTAQRNLVKGLSNNGEGSQDTQSSSSEQTQLRPKAGNVSDGDEDSQTPDWEKLLQEMAPDHRAMSNFMPALVGPVDFLLLVSSYVLILAVTWGLAPSLMKVIPFAVIAAFLVYRHYTLTKGLRGNGMTVGKIWLTDRHQPGEPSTFHLPAAYFLYILGSGGHTTELCATIKKKMRSSQNMHRRYLLTEEDYHSFHSMKNLESAIKKAYTLGSDGTWDIATITRARRVHQSYFSAIFTTLLSAWRVMFVLGSRPPKRRENSDGDSFKWPHVLITNGPGTGFVVAMVVHLLKIFYLVPQDRLKVVYIETWAQVTKLSLTGRLFYWTDIADLFIIQHEELAAKYGKLYIDLVNRPTSPRWARP